MKQVTKAQHSAFGELELSETNLSFILPPSPSWDWVKYNLFNLNNMINISSLLSLKQYDLSFSIKAILIQSFQIYNSEFYT